MSFFSKIWNLLRGYVTITIEGYFLEKFTNLCFINNIPFWNIKKYGSTKMTGRTTIKGFKLMRFQAKKSGCRIAIGRKKGTPFILHKYRKRKIFVIGAIVFFICLKVAYMFIWDIKISGNENIDDNEILMTLDELGVKKWTFKKSIEVRDISNLFIARRDDTSWIGLDIRGLSLYVKVVEKSKTPDKVDENFTCNIVASKPALIVSIDTYQGKAMVAVGDIVDGGTILVAGIMEMKQFPEKTEKVHSLASIKGKVWYEKSRSLKLSENRPDSQVEKFAYNLAYQNIMAEIPKNAEILNVSQSTAYISGKVIVTVTVESLEEIGVEAPN